MPQPFARPEIWTLASVPGFAEAVAAMHTKGPDAPASCAYHAFEIPGSSSESSRMLT